MPPQALVVSSGVRSSTRSIAEGYPRHPHATKGATIRLKR
jgi:hypothetical protein